MATRPTITTVSSGAIYSPSVLNTNFTNIRDAFDALLGTDGTSGDNNDMTGDLNLNGNTLRNALFDSDTVGVSWEGNWAASTSYSANDIVYDTTANILYICNTSHTSSGTEPISSNADSAKWDTLIDGSSLSGLSDIVDDTTPQAGGTFDFNGNDAQFDDATGIQDDSGNYYLRFQKTASAVNYLDVTNAAAGSEPSISAVGSDTDIDVTLVPKGSGTVDVSSSIIENVTDPTSAQHAATKAYVDSAVSNTLPRGYISGLIISNNSTDSDHDIDITVGEAKDSANGTDISLASALTKRIDATWASGTNAGGRSSSVSLSTNTWYAVHAIIVGGSADIGFDTSATAANLIADHSATAYRLIGWVLTDGSSNIVGFSSVEVSGGGLRVTWDAQQTDHSGAVGTSASLITITAPINTQAWGSGTLTKSDSAVVTIRLSETSQTDVAASTGDVLSAGTGISNDQPIGASYWSLLVDSSNQIRAIAAAASTTLNLQTEGWVEYRRV